MTITVRPARPDDATGIAAAHVRAWQAAFDRAFPAAYLESLDVDDWTVNRRHSILNQQPHMRMFVALTDGEIIGFTHGGAYRRDRQDATAGEVYALYVDPAHWSSRAGYALMTTVVDELVAAGRTVIRLWTLDDNPRARAFYERFGFVDDGERDTYRVEDGGRYDTSAVIMRYTLHVR
jgi:ribosomal protein S18 acetylase RimI-like enzyme